jgi:hypothetical protein
MELIPLVPLSPTIEHGGVESVLDGKRQVPIVLMC